MGTCQGVCLQYQGEGHSQETLGLRELAASARRRRTVESSGGQDPLKEACCLKWAISAYDQAHADDEQILSLHQEIGSCVRFFGSQIVEDDVVSGMIIGHPLETGSMSAADTLVRLGQILCRWASAQSPAFGLHIGVHVGRLEVMELPNSNGRKAHFGMACAGATRLAQAAEKAVVHLSGRVRDHLSALRLLRMTVSPTVTDAYYLAPETAVVKDNQEEHKPLGRLDVREPSAIHITPDRKNNRMTFTEFADMLEGYGIDTSKFGHGNAKTLQQFYDTVVHEGKCYLTVRNDCLERVVELVRISLRISGAGNRQRELRLHSEKNAQGGKRIRNQPLAMVLQASDNGGWQAGLEALLKGKFGLPVETQKECFTVEDHFSNGAEKAASETVPGIITTYLSHNVILSVNDVDHPELARIGLPGGGNFTTGNGLGLQTWMWNPVVDSKDTKEGELMALLQRSGVDISDFTWQSFQELYEEVYETATCHLEEINGTLMRIINLVKVWLHVDLFNLDYVLVIRSKKKPTGYVNTTKRLRVLTMRMKDGQDWRQAVEEVLFSRLGIDPNVQESQLQFDLSSHMQSEEVDVSASHPGLKCLYRIHEVSVRILDAQNPHWRYMGLPNGCDFSISRKGFKPRQPDAADDFIITQWGWQLQDDVLAREQIRREQEALTRPSVADVIAGPGTHGSGLHSLSSGRSDIEEAGSMLSVPFGKLHQEAEVLTQYSRPGKPNPRVEPPQVLQVRNEDELLLTKLMLGRRTDWPRARRAAEKMLDKDYTTRHFYDDVCKAFPELRLYCICRDDIERTTLGLAQRTTGTSGTDRSAEELQATSAGRGADDEYQRTVGALFAVFWLMRMHLDGKECFCFGLDPLWNPRSRADFDSENPDEEADYQKRQAFYEATDWEALQRLLIGAGLLKQSGGPHDPERTLTILVLMTIHDIMKLDVLLPTVTSPVTDFCGYKTGESIFDHDIALSYVLEHCPFALPSFSGLNKSQQDSIKFTHSKLEYNMGWLVQAEAPPGALFTAFRKVIISGKVSSSDVAFYFVHWFADLAGAEPYPMRGCEKFVVKFPQRVLATFVDSFPVVWTLGKNKTETQVFEDYLLWRWKNHEPPLPEPPTGKGSIAQMRLILMAQGDSLEILRNFNELPQDDWNVLCEELAMTGCPKERFSRDSVKESKIVGKGPSILVYYSPALMQRAGRTDPRGALMVLAEVFRQARELWPLSDKSQDVGRTVIVRIDALKDLEVEAIRRPRAGYGFVLVKTSGMDGQVKLLPISTFRNLDWTTHQVITVSDGRGKLASAYRKLRATAILRR